MPKFEFYLNGTKIGGTVASCGADAIRVLHEQFKAMDLSQVVTYQIPAAPYDRQPQPTVEDEEE